MVNGDGEQTTQHTTTHGTANALTIKSVRLLDCLLSRVSLLDCLLSRVCLVDCLLSRVCLVDCPLSRVSLLDYLLSRKVFYGQEPPCGESTTTECGFNYQLLAVVY